MSGAVFTVTAPRAIREAITPATRAAASELLGLAIAGTPVDLGALRGGWTMHPGYAPGAFVIENSVPHGRYVEHGSKGTPGRHMLGVAAAIVRGRYGAR